MPALLPLQIRGCSRKLYDSVPVFSKDSVNFHFFQRLLEEQNERDYLEINKFGKLQKSPFTSAVFQFESVLESSFLPVIRTERKPHSSCPSSGAG